jgi:hypothetical protein
MSDDHEAANEAYEQLEAHAYEMRAARDAALARCAKLTMALATCVTWMEVGEVRGFQEPIAAARALLADTQEVGP